MAAWHEDQKVNLKPSPADRVRCYSLFLNFVNYRVLDCNNFVVGTKNKKTETDTAAGKTFLCHSSQIVLKIKSTLTEKKQNWFAD